MNGYYKAELIRGPAREGRPWKSVEDVELATLGYVDWHNHERLHSYPTTCHPQSSSRRSTLRTGPTNLWSKSNSPSLHQTQGGSDMVVVADAGMLSASNLKELDEANLRFIVGSRVTKAPKDLESHFRWHGDAFADGQVIDTITPRTGHKIENDTRLKAEPVWDPGAHPGSWRAVWAYSAKRAVRDNKTLTLQENRAQQVVVGERTARTPRFVKTTNGAAELDEASLARARRLVGLKGYVTNIPADTMTAGEVIGSYHDLWRVEQSFRMSKTDLRARPMFHHKRESIEAHLTIVFTALAVARHLQNRTGVSIKKLVQTLRPLREVTITVAAQTITAQPQEVVPALVELEVAVPRLTPALR